MIKRLKLIKELIQQKDYCEIELELEALKAINNMPDELMSICLLLGNEDYADAVGEIDNYIHNKSIPQHLQDTSTAGLKTQIKLLETELSVLVNKKAEMNKMITSFRLMHHSKLGMVIAEILHLRKEIALKEFLEQNPDKDADKDEKVNEAKKDYKDFKKSSEHSKKHAYKQINKEKKKLLQALFRKASKLCHPDVVNDKVREQAEQLFAQLNDAYYRNDLQKLQELYDLLQKNKNIYALKWEEINEIDRLEAIVTKLNTDVHNIRTEINETKKTEAHETIVAIGNWEEYFAKIKSKLEKELKKLREEYERKQEPAS